nr:MAG TPA: hypothetical protein [Caudoviricetes sp.]
MIISWTYSILYSLPLICPLYTKKACHTSSNA